MLSTFCAAFFLTRRGGLFASAAYAAAICFRKLITLSRIRSWCAFADTDDAAKVSAFHSLWVGKAGGKLLQSSPPLDGASVLSA
jgi:hypothetical protein